MGEFQILRIATIAWVMFCTAACAASGVSEPRPAARAEAAAPAFAGALTDYKLGPSDRIRLIVYGEPELSGEFSINSRGEVSLPLLGEIPAAGATIDDLRAKIAAGLSEGYVNDARVAAEVIEFRPFYILGEVTRPGEYPYSTSMTAMKAIAAAGGFTYRARKSSVFIKRADEAEERKIELTPDLKIYPGDVIRVSERFF